MPENEKQTNRERLKDITDSIERGIQELFQSDKYAAYLRTMSRFHKYSVNNQMLIYMQKPDATLVAGFNKWRDQFERNVMKGEKGIKIIAPTPFKKKIEEQKLDPDTMLPMLDADGKVIMEERKSKSPCSNPSQSLTCHRLRESLCRSWLPICREMCRTMRSSWNPCGEHRLFLLTSNPSVMALTASFLWTIRVLPSARA